MPPRSGFFHACLASAAVTVMLSACAGPPKPAPTPVAAGLVATPNLTANERLALIVQLLEKGSSAQARVEALALQAEQPAIAKRLLDQIDVNPMMLLGSRHFTYKVRPGETLSQIAERFLGDPLLFYALARYNGIDTPERMERGRMLKIPGVAKKPSGPPVKGSAPASSPAGPTRNTGRAGELRAAALEDMNSGAIDRAIARLRQALRLDPDNAVIKRDLDRAQRILETVRAR